MEEKEFELTVDELKKDKKILKQFEKNKSKAEDLLKDKDKMDKFLERLERKLSSVPKIGEYLSDIPIFISLVRSYISGEYRVVPMGSLIAVVSALIYFLSPVDVIPDIIPGMGLVDDAAVISLAYFLVHDDIEEYKLWRDKNKNQDRESN
ncbi:YkvA family protein [Anaerosphaera multitolerans]|uniref:DUF1232 domain-containing protein n=1 Tax=Anaerosphaera multitolerans TaxID=2487351 RepID=A0A437S8N0_9FIRM|nr:YkvA family protein [Anaerosphaera multitolerans]RVU55455.1 DUF1232 domain-containing protein [Anaerosphaera multitolerans]